MDKKKNKHRVKPEKSYKITFGVNQTEKVDKAANKVDETPQQFLINAVIDAANKITE